jgi:hypothetical protein
VPKLTLTDFVEIVDRSGSSKIAKVADIKRRPRYQPAFDFYKIIREALEETHRTGKGKAHLQQVLGSLKDPKKQVNYPAIVAGYSKWWGQKTFQWFNPPSADFSHAGVTVAVRPELGLEFNGQKHIIKLYFKGDALSKRRVNLVTCLMEHSLRGSAPSGAIISVLDTRTAKLFSGGATSPSMIAGLRAELSYVATLWPNV